MSSENTALWDNLGRTDPAHTKAFSRSGGFKGTAIKPMWSYRRLTEEFGPCGKGWGVGKPEFQVVPGPEGEVLVFCTVSIWWSESPSDMTYTVYGVGGDKAVGKNKYGLNSDDEAFKKAFTDAVTNALKMIGVGADVHMGLFDDSKYVNDMRAEFSDEPQKPAPTPNTAKGPTNAYPLRKGWEWQEGDPNARSSAMLKKEGSIDGFTDEVDACNNMADLKWVENKWITHARKSGWTDAWKHTACNRIETREAEIIASMSPDALADVPLADALKHSLSQHPQ